MTRRGSVGVALEVVVPLAALAIWWFASSNSDSFYFPPLSEILSTFADTWLFERVEPDLAPSVARLLAGYTLAVAFGIGGGLLLGLSPVAQRLTAPIVEFLRAIPPVALIPAAILVFGIGDGMKIVIVAMACLWPILLNAVDGVAAVEPTLLETARSYGIRPVDRVRSVVLPAALPQIFAGMRTSLSIAIIVMVVSEMVASTDGVGFFILESQSSFAITEMWSGILLLGILGYLLNLAFTRVERRVLRWHRGARESALAET